MIIFKFAWKIRQKNKQHIYPFKWTMELCCCCSQPTQDLRFMKSNRDLKEPLNFDSKNLKKLMHHWFWKFEIPSDFGIWRFDGNGQKNHWKLGRGGWLLANLHTMQEQHQKLKQLLGHGNGRLRWPICDVDSTIEIWCI
jgi:hypothetical protein